MIFKSNLFKDLKVSGTKQRSKNCLFVYNCGKMKPGDCRQVVSTTGPREFWIKTSDFKGRQVSMVANRNGRGGVTLGVTTEFGQYKFDVVLENPADLGWYKKLEENKLSKLDVLRRCFRPHDAKCSKDVTLSKLGSMI